MSRFQFITSQLEFTLCLAIYLGLIYGSLVYLVSFLSAATQYIPAGLVICALITAGLTYWLSRRISKVQHRQMQKKNYELKSMAQTETLRAQNLLEKWGMAEKQINEQKKEIDALYLAIKIKDRKLRLNDIKIDDQAHGLNKVCAELAEEKAAHEALKKECEKLKAQNAELKEEYENLQRETEIFIPVLTKQGNQQPVSGKSGGIITLDTTVSKQ